MTDDDTIGSLLDAFLNDQRIAALVAEVESLQGSAVIEQAKGVLMHTLGIGPDAAFAILVAAAEKHGVTIRVVAAELANAQDTTADG